ncbi:hypothetical protein CERSUDRAFT_119204 [Gelatoporia subvermispora B]|uniref:RING-type domain-containing protein n=1 Tax=Ceriporiopsis subvermispora (strain B) TaxID=914234 RepID=M2QIJ1_CERS8|nr:hypothetical protein CERSUDRAFT_119204 [Gelatoporia subvermispora B]
MAKHSFVPASAPTSPAVTRSKSDRHPPVTPQRIPVRNVQHPYASPYTPATTSSTPYTPLSLRSFSSSSVSTLATPASAASRRRLSLSVSPEVSTNAKSLADIAQNWRTRANENGIRVTSSDDSHYKADDSLICDMSSSSIDKALLPAPFLSTHRRARAHSQAQAPLSQIHDPVQFSTPSRPVHSGILNTPPPQPLFRLRGSVTDPAHTRRRPAFEQNSELFDIEEDEYAPYPPAFTQPASQTLPLALNDPFETDLSDLSGISEPMQLYETPDYAVETPPMSAQANPTNCSVCGSTGGSLAILEPCRHPLCSACLTSALNIVGEKDMECAVCKAKVDDFQLRKSSFPAGAAATEVAKPFQPSVDQGAFMDDAGFDSGISLLPSAFDGNMCIDMSGFGDPAEFFDRAQGASTPVAGVRARRSFGSTPDESVVLRIDNVPWDITPPAIADWLKHPVERVHVLLDRKGKTLSHAYVEMASADAAKAALRSSQNAVLGKGKRARGVTVTRSSQEELMRSLFPSWLGNFDGGRPSLAGLDNEHVISTLQRGLLSEAELNSLLHLIRSPDSHFLKVPSLPFHSLISVLSKFPADDDSRVFWSGSLRDMIYEITYAAVQVLLARIEENPLSDWTSLMSQLVRAAMNCQAFTSEQMSKLSDILEAALPQSMSSPPGSRSSISSPDSVQNVIQQPPVDIPMYTAVNTAQDHPHVDQGAYKQLAEEFGVEPHLIEALAQRLSGMF